MEINKSKLLYDERVKKWRTSTHPKDTKKSKLYRPPQAHSDVSGVGSRSGASIAGDPNAAGNKSSAVLQRYCRGDSPGLLGSSRL